VNQRFKKYILGFAAGTATKLLACVLVISLFVGTGLAVRVTFADFLRRQLTYERPLPDATSTPDDVVYVLGGTPYSLRAKFETASRLVQSGKAARILVQSRQTLMAFSPVLGGNPTADEWVVQTLSAFGIGPDKIEFITFREGFFGTWSEAKGLSRIVRERGYRRLILVTSSYHSRRTWDCFSRTIDRPERTLYLYLSREPTYLRHLLPEYFKLILYHLLLL